MIFHFSVLAVSQVVYPYPGARKTKMRANMPGVQTTTLMLLQLIMHSICFGRYIRLLR
ncbi:hypothetical protein P879_09868 [Paragonimus westermani]|uniref:Uncharacterized protein n=1 Tax=Paragonimus westermani TaxID=34504 RepID=A0A8T0DN86_9TREM|nr:hypothetical protein P879_09868 [Paragonimus westermani]